MELLAAGNAGSQIPPAIDTLKPNDNARDGKTLQGIQRSPDAPPPRLLVNQFCFQGREETFCHGIVVLLIVLGVSAYGEGRVRGYETTDCTGQFLEAGSLGELDEYHDQEDGFGNTWHFESFLYVNVDQTCLEYDMEEVVVVGERLPGSSSGSGGSGSGSSTGAASGQGAHGVVGPDEFTDEMNKKLKDCLVEDLNAIASVTHWVGEETGSTWSKKSRREVGSRSKRS